MNIKLSDLLRIQSADDYNAVYPQIASFSEEEMLLLKEVMERQIKYNNPSQTEATEIALALIRERLGINEIPTDKINFIRTLIKDYVALSR